MRLFTTIILCIVLSVWEATSIDYSEMKSVCEMRKNSRIIEIDNILEDFLRELRTEKSIGEIIGTFFLSKYHLSSLSYKFDLLIKRVERQIIRLELEPNCPKNMEDIMKTIHGIEKEYHSLSEKFMICPHEQNALPPPKTGFFGRAKATQPESRTYQERKKSIEQNRKEYEPDSCAHIEKDIESEDDTILESIRGMFKNEKNFYTNKISLPEKVESDFEGAREALEKMVKRKNSFQESACDKNISKMLVPREMLKRDRAERCIFNGYYPETGHVRESFPLNFLKRLIQMDFLNQMRHISAKHNGLSDAEIWRINDSAHKHYDVFRPQATLRTFTTFLNMDGAEKANVMCGREKWAQMPKQSVAKKTITESPKSKSNEQKSADQHAANNKKIEPAEPSTSIKNRKSIDVNEKDFCSKLSDGVNRTKENIRSKAWDEAKTVFDETFNKEMDKQCQNVKDLDERKTDQHSIIENLIQLYFDSTKTNDCAGFVKEFGIKMAEILDKVCP